MKIEAVAIIWLDTSSDDKLQINLAWPSYTQQLNKFTK